MEKNNQKNKTSFGETINSLVIAVILAMLFRSLLFEPFYIPSGSMKSTLLVGDYLFVSKYNYGYSRYSFPFGLPIFKGRIFEDKPQVGDVVVFRLPKNPSINYIKRLIGLPGDKIQMIDGKLHINGKKLDVKQIDNFIDKDQHGNEVAIARYIETLPNGVSHTILDQDLFGPLDNTHIYEVPEGHYFFMGDNRDNSQDSRMLNEVGFVPEENILGPAGRIFFSSEYPFYQFWKWPSSLRFERFFDDVNYQEQ